MKGDFTRSTFDPRKHFTSVLMQQGRVQLDADGNEQAAILWHYLRTLATDLIGPHGGPSAEPGFEITFDQDGNRVTDLTISRGRYYVEGLLCENEEEDEAVIYYNQPGYPLDEDRDALPDLPFLVYLDVWERHVTAIEDPGIREDGLGASAPDTASRAQVVWQVKTTDEIPDDFDTSNITKENVEAYWDRWIEKWQPADRGRLKAKAKEDRDEDADPCIISPEARYRGIENQLYRVEIHRGGSAWDGSNNGYEGDYSDNGSATLATFKWSRDNGSVTFPIRDLEGSVVTLEHLGRDSGISLKVGDLVEIEDNDYVLKGHAEPLLRVEAIDPINIRVTLSGEPGVGRDPAKHPLLRRWDHGAGNSEKGELEPDYGDLRLRENAWITLEDGVQVCFQPAGQEGSHTYRTGDYWLIPARTATGDVEWPGDVGQPEARPPHGTEHHYAPLAVVVSTGDNPVDCRCVFEPLCESNPPAYRPRPE
jgi:hypothetical protein